MIELIKGNGMEGSDVIVRGGPAFKSSDDPGFVRIMEDGTLKVNGFLGNASYRDDVFISALNYVLLVEGESYVNIADAGLVDIVLTFKWGASSVISNSTLMANIRGMRLSSSTKIKGINMTVWNPNGSLKQQLNSSHPYIFTVSNDTTNTSSLVIMSSDSASSYPQMLNTLDEKARVEFVLQASDFSQITF
jgi:hypothetical protein